MLLCFFFSGLCECLVIIMLMFLVVGLRLSCLRLCSI